MSIRAVLQLGHLALRQRAREIQDEVFGTQQLQTLIDDLLETKAARSGAGLAAPQIDEPWRVVVVGMGTNPRYPQAPPAPERVLINPEPAPSERRNHRRLGRLPQCARAAGGRWRPRGCTGISGRSICVRRFAASVKSPGRSSLNRWSIGIFSSFCIGK
jgi:hypothetical protein